MMSPAIGLPLMAPQPTGHPAALPADPPAVRSDLQIKAASAGSNASGARTGDDPGSSDAPVAPPSAMQLKIMEILKDQAENLRTADQGG